MRVLVHGAADAVAAEVGVQAVPGGASDRADRGGDISDPSVGLGRGDPGLQRGFGAFEQSGVGVAGGPDAEGDRGVAGPAVEGGAAVDAEQVAGAQSIVGGVPCRTASFTDKQTTPGYGVLAKDGW
jgi:hypothetical protein